MELRGQRESYHIEREVGRGGFGVAYAARGQDTGQEVLIKVLQIEQLEQWKAFSLFEREAEVLMSLDHPGIPRFVDRIHDERGQLIAMVQQLVHGQTLHALIRSGQTLPLARVQRALRDALEILRHLHAQAPPVIHRDVSPKNLILGQDRLWLVDFGAVKAALMDSTTMTAAGTFGYMPPEQIMGRAEPASDMYALGMSFIALLTKTSPEQLPISRATGQPDPSPLLAHTPEPTRSVLLDMIRPGLDARLGDPSRALARLDSSPSAAARARRPAQDSPNDEVVAAFADLEAPEDAAPVATGATGATGASSGAKMPVLPTLALVGVALLGGSVFLLDSMTPPSSSSSTHQARPSGARVVVERAPASSLSCSSDVTWHELMWPVCVERCLADELDACRLAVDRMDLTIHRQEAQPVLRKACDLGDGDACHRLGQGLLHGELGAGSAPPRRDPKAAVLVWLELCARVTRPSLDATQAFVAARGCQDADHHMLEVDDDSALHLRWLEATRAALRACEPATLHAKDDATLVTARAIACGLGLWWAREVRSSELADTAQRALVARCADERAQRAVAALDPSRTGPLTLPRAQVACALSASWQAPAQDPCASGDPVACGLAARQRLGATGRLHGEAASQAAAQLERACDLGDLPSCLWAAHAFGRASLDARGSLVARGAKAMRPGWATRDAARAYRLWVLLDELPSGFVLSRLHLAAVQEAAFAGSPQEREAAEQIAVARMHRLAASCKQAQGPREDAAAGRCRAALDLARGLGPASYDDVILGRATPRDAALAAKIGQLACARQLRWGCSVKP